MTSPRISIFFTIFCLVSSTEFDIENYEMIDGILVNKNASALVEELKEAKKVEDSSELEDEEEFTYEADEISEKDSPEEDLEMTKHLPTKCHVCRLLVEEVEDGLAKFGVVRKTRENKPPIYWKEEKVLLLALEDLCKRMRKYNIRRTYPFRYKKGVKSSLRRNMDEVTKNSRIKEFVFLTPDEHIDDPTGEISRLEQQCHKMLVDEQHMIMHWFLKSQSRDLTQWLCADRVLIGEEQDCLKFEVPTAAKRQSQKENELEKETTEKRRQEL